MMLFQGSLAQCVYSCPLCLTGELILSNADSNGSEVLNASDWVMEATADCTVPVASVGIDWYWIPDATGVVEPKPAFSGTKSEFEHVGAPDDFEFEVDWKCPNPDCFTTSPVLLVYQAYDTDGNVLWEDYLLLRTVKCDDTLTSPITIHDFLP